jgi:hypothetical protein
MSYFLMGTRNTLLEYLVVLASKETLISTQRIWQGYSELKWKGSKMAKGGTTWASKQNHIGL